MIVRMWASHGHRRRASCLRPRLTRAAPLALPFAAWFQPRDEDLDLTIEEFLKARVDRMQQVSNGVTLLAAMCCACGSWRVACAAKRGTVRVMCMLTHAS